MPLASRSGVRLRFSGSDVNSSRLRTTEESRLLRQSGGGIQVVFSTCEVAFGRCWIP